MLGRSSTRHQVRAISTITNGVAPLPLTTRTSSENGQTLVIELSSNLKRPRSDFHDPGRRAQ